MPQLTKKQLEKLTKNDVIFTINPYGLSSNNQKNVQIFTAITKYVKNDKIYSYSSSCLTPNLYRDTRFFIGDIISNGVKAVFSDYEEALQYLALVHANKFLNEVHEHHEKSLIMWK